MYAVIPSLGQLMQRCHPLARPPENNRTIIESDSFCKLLNINMMQKESQIRGSITKVPARPLPHLHSQGCPK